MTVIWTDAFARVFAALRPPKPAPTMTTRGVTLLAILLSALHLYKIHRDGRWFQKFFDVDCGVGSRGDAFHGRPDFCCLAGRPSVHTTLCTFARRRGNWLAHSHRAANSGSARYPARGFVFFNDGGKAMVRLGVAL